MINTYATLKQAIQTYGKRSDALSHLDEFIATTETQMTSNEDEILKIRQMEQSFETTLGAGSSGDSIWASGFWADGFWGAGFWAGSGSSGPLGRFVTLPSGFIEARRVKLTVGESFVYLEQKTPFNMRYKTGSGIPSAFTITDTLELDIVPAGQYELEMTYFGDLEPLSATNTTNVILTKHHTIYLYGCLQALHLWARNEQLADYYYRLFIGAIKGANKRARLGRYGPAPQMRVTSSTP
jgi:hypothetical protein